MYVNVEIYGIHKSNESEEFKLNSSFYNEHELRCQIEQKHGIPRFEQSIKILSNGKRNIRCEVRDLRSFVVDLKLFNGFNHCTDQIFWERYNYTKDQDKTFKDLKKSVMQKTGLPAAEQIYLSENVENKLDIGDDESLFSVFQAFSYNSQSQRYYGCLRQGCLLLYLTNRSGYYGKNAVVWRYPVKVYRSFETDNECILSTEIIFNPFLKRYEKSPTDVEFLLSHMTMIPKEYLILQNKDGEKFDTEPRQFYRYEESNDQIVAFFTQSLENAEVVLYLSVDHENIGEKRLKIWEEFNNCKLQTVVLKSLTKTETLPFTNPNDLFIKDIKSYIFRTRKIPIRSQQLMMNDVIVSDGQLLSEVFDKQRQGETTALELYLIIKVECIRIHFHTYPFYEMLNFKKKFTLDLSKHDTIKDIKDKIGLATLDKFSSDITEVWSSELSTNLDSEKTVEELSLKDGTNLYLIKYLQVTIYEQRGKEQATKSLKLMRESSNLQDILEILEERHGYKKKKLRLRPIPLRKTPDCIELDDNELIFDYKL